MEIRPIEVSAPDVEKAIERGLAQLGLAREQVQVEVVDTGSRGILGIGSRDAVVRLNPTPQPEEPIVVQPEPDPEPETAPAQAVQAVVADTPRPAAQASETPSEEYTLSEHQVAEIAQQTLAELLGKMGIECEVVIRPPRLRTRIRP